jgi:hypothetical protein
MLPRGVIRVAATTARHAVSRAVAAAIAALALAVSSSPVDGATAAPQTFASPEEAVQIFVAALKANDEKAVLAILGSEAKPLVDSGDEVADDTAAQRFVASYEQAHSLVKNGDATVLQVGTDEWPFPIPLVERDGRWHFDTAAGKQEVLARRIGRNELAAMNVALAYVDAQREYHQRNPQNAKLAPYAQRIASSSGKKDGLYWPTKDGEPESPLGPLVASARGEGYKQAGNGTGEPYHGYYYRVLTGQGADATGGAYDYMVRGAMIGGFALVAYPAEWGNSGVMTFLVNHDGVIYEKDLGPDTAKTARSMKLFNPDATWKTVDPPAIASSEQ